MEFVKSEIEHKEPIMVGFSILQYVKLRMLELYYNFFHKYSDVTKSEGLETDTDLLYLALSEQDLNACIRPAIKKMWNSLRSGDCTDEFSANSTKVFSRFCCADYKTLDRRKRTLFNEEFCCRGMICLCVKTYCCYDSQSKNSNLGAEA